MGSVSCVSDISLMAVVGDACHSILLPSALLGVFRWLFCHGQVPVCPPGCSGQVKIISVMHIYCVEDVLEVKVDQICSFISFSPFIKLCFIAPIQYYLLSNILIVMATVNKWVFLLSSERYG